MESVALHSASHFRLCGAEISRKFNFACHN